MQCYAKTDGVRTLWDMTVAVTESFSWHMENASWYLSVS